MRSKGLICVLTACLLAGCIDDTKHDLTETKPAEVNALGTFSFVPETARSVDYLEAGALDTVAYIHFEDSRANVDAFALKVLGYLPSGGPTAFEAIGAVERPWWPKALPAQGRSGLRRKTELGIRHVLVVDHPDRSEIWAVYGQGPGSGPKVTDITNEQRDADELALEKIIRESKQ